MDALKELGNGDYGPDTFFFTTTSWSDGIQEVDQFYPNLPRPVKRTNSADDIQCYKDNFYLGQKNVGKCLKWKYYLKLLIDDMLDFDTSALVKETLMEDNGKNIRKRTMSSRESDISLYFTASEAENVEKGIPRNEKCRKKSFETKFNADKDSVFFMKPVSSKRDCSPETVSRSSASSVEIVNLDSTFSWSSQKNKRKTMVEDNESCIRERELSSKETGISYYFTATEAESIEKPESKNNIWRKKSFADNADIDSGFCTNACRRKYVPFKEVVSINNNFPLSPQNNILKKFCSEVRQLATKASKIVEKLSVRSKYCSVCGEIVNPKKNDIKGPPILRNVTDKNKPISAKSLNMSSDILELSSEVRRLADETSRIVEKMLIKPKHCSNCGNNNVLIKGHKEYHEYVSNGEDFKQPIARPSMLKDAKLTRMYSMSLTSMASITSGNSTVNAQFTKHMPASDKKKC